MEKLARDHIEHRTPPMVSCCDIARALLLLLPVVRAAEAWSIGHVDAPPIMLSEQDLLRAVRVLQGEMRPRPLNRAQAVRGMIARGEYAGCSAAVCLATIDAPLLLDGDGIRWTLSDAGEWHCPMHAVSALHSHTKASR